MDSYEATTLLFAKIKNLDPENASKIMGYLLIQDLADKDLVRLALGPEALLQSLIFKAKTHLGLSSNVSSPSSPSPFNPIARPLSSNPFSQSQSSPRMPNNGFDLSNNPSSPSSAGSWGVSAFLSNPLSPSSSHFLSYDNIRAGSFPMPHFLQRKNGNGDPTAASVELMDDQLSEYLSFLNDSSSSSGSEDFIGQRFELGPGFQNWTHSLNNGEAHYHRRSYSASDVCSGSEDGGLALGYKPCLYFAKGFCKNGGNCKFSHGGFPDSVDSSGFIVGSPSKFEEILEHREEFSRLKASQQQRLVAGSQLMSGLPSPQYNKYLNFLLQQNDPQRAAAAVVGMGEELHKLGHCRSERNEFLAMASAEKRTSASRQIYLTFPAESTFKDEDVSEYFSKFGPVQDVRIPYQQKRMFGFVTFVYPETVKLILAKGNPHFICDSRVLVKPYKEKGKIPEKRQQLQQQQLERAEFSQCLSPSGIDVREAYDLNFGPRTMYNTQEMLLRRKLEEQAELQQAIEFQGRRLMNLQLPDLNHHRTTHHQRSISLCAPLPSEAHANMTQNAIVLPDFMKTEVAQGNNDTQAGDVLKTSQRVQLQAQVNPVSIHVNRGGKSEVETSSSNCEQFGIDGSVEQVLPDNLFASPEKSAEEQQVDFSTAIVEVSDASGLSATSQNNSLAPSSSARDITSL